MANIVTQQVVPPTLGSNSEPPPRSDGATRLYTAYICPYAQRAWIALNYKGLQDKIQLVPINLDDKPAWYKDVYPPGKVPALEQNNQVKGESLDLLNYFDTHFEGPPLFRETIHIAILTTSHKDPAKKEFAEEMFTYSGTFSGAVYDCLKGSSETETKAAFDKLEEALSKFDDGPFFLGQFSAADIAYAPLIERFQPLLLELKKYGITIGRPRLTTWLENLLELNKVEAYKQSKYDINELLSSFKRRALGI